MDNNDKRQTREDSLSENKTRDPKARIITEPEKGVLKRLVELARTPGTECLVVWECSECSWSLLVPVGPWDELPQDIRLALIVKGQAEHYPTCDHSGSVYQPNGASKKPEDRILYAMHKLGREPHFGQIRMKAMVSLEKITPALNNLLRCRWIVQGVRPNTIRLFRNAPKQLPTSFV